MPGGKGITSMKTWMLLLFCLSPILATITLSPMLDSASAQTPACLNVGCGETHFAADASGPYTNETYTWTNSNSCGSFGPLPSFPAQAFWNYTFGTSGVGNDLYCNSLQGTISVTISLTYSAGSFVVMCTDPNGANGADFSSAGPNGTTSCIYPNGTSTSPRGAPFTIGDFYGQQSLGQIASGSSTTSSPTTTTAQSSSTGVPVTPGPLLTTSELTLLVVGGIGIAAVISIAYFFRGRLGLSNGGGPGKTQEKPPGGTNAPKPIPEDDGHTGGTPPGQNAPNQLERLGISITKCSKYWSPEGVNSTDFVAKIYKCVGGQGWVDCDVSAVITFKLHYVSNLAGYCTNGGAVDGFNPDLWFSKEENGEEEWMYPLNDNTDPAKHFEPCESPLLGQDNEDGHWHYQWIKTKGPKNEAKVTVRSEDYGAWGWIEATAEAGKATVIEHLPPREDEDSPVPCPAEGNKCCVAVGPVPDQMAWVRPDKPPGEAKKWKPLRNAIMSWWVKIPRDENNNNIPDYMEKWDQGNANEEGAQRDDDDHPGGMGNGDGMTVFEEYRGFVKEDGTKYWHHVRTDPAKKTVFVFIPQDDTYYKQLKELVDNPLATFVQTGLEIYKITERYGGATPSVTKFVKIQNKNSNVELNFNRDWGRGMEDVKACSQSAIWLKGRPDMPNNILGFACSAGADSLSMTKAGRELQGDMWDPPPPNEGIPGTPGAKTHCCINVPLCGKDKAHPNRLNEIVAHELGHTVSLQHHGEGGVHPHPDIYIKNKNIYSGCWQGLLTSGDESCVMHYDTVATTIKWWCEPDPNSMPDVKKDKQTVTYPNAQTVFGTAVPVKDWSQFKHANPTDTRAQAPWKGLLNSMHVYSNDGPGVTYCSSRAGTGNNNEDGKNNGATLGNCKGFLKVKDWP